MTDEAAEDRVFRIRISRYYNCDVGGVEASHSYTIDPADIDKLLWPDLIRRMLDKVSTSVHEMPVSDVREMTAEEVDAFWEEQGES